MKRHYPPPIPIKCIKCGHILHWHMRDGVWYCYNGECPLWGQDDLSPEVQKAEREAMSITPDKRMLNLALDLKRLQDERDDKDLKIKEAKLLIRDNLAAIALAAGMTITSDLKNDYWSGFFTAKF